MADVVHWADILADRMLKENGKNLVAIGITPSGSINIGNVREAVTADTIYKVLLDKGEDADFICIVDNFEPLHKAYAFLPESYVDYVGKPISEVPCPCGTCANYAEHFLKPFLRTLKRIGINPRVYMTDEMYRAGRYNEAIETALTSRDDIVKILEELSKKALESDWSPFNPICDKCRMITKTKVNGFNPQAKTVDYTCACGHSGTVPMAGGGKLTWRVEWAARCTVLGITIEAFGKDRSLKGSSYDSVKKIAKEIFRHKAPYPVVCEQILPGKHRTVNFPKKVIDSSVEAAVQVSDLLAVIPPGFLRHLVIRTKPEKQINLDAGQSFLTLMDEYERLRGQFRGKDPSIGTFERRICELSRLTDICQSEIPFKQMATIYQVARGDFDQILKIIRRSGFSSEDEKCIKELADNVSLWLELYAPPFAKFNIKETVPVQAAILSMLQKAFLSAFAALIKSREKLSGEEFHMLIYSAAEEGSELNRRIAERINARIALQIDPRDLFKAIYISVLGQSSGPRAGWFLSSLEKEFLVKRFEEASSFSPEKADNMDKPDICTHKSDAKTCESDTQVRAGSRANSAKEHFLAWDKEYSHLRWGGPASVMNLLAYIQPGSGILDAGSGNGRYLGELTRYYDAVGIDISLTALRSSRVQLAKSGRFAEHIRANVHEFPFKARSFDGILCYGVLQHLFRDEREAAVMEFGRVLRKGGLIFFEVFGSEDMRCGGDFSTPFEKNTFSRQNGLIYHYFTKEEARALFNEFEVVELENVIKEKTFRGEVYKRHMVRGIFRKS